MILQIVNVFLTSTCQDALGNMGVSGAPQVFGASAIVARVIENWLVVWNMNVFFPFSWECHHPN